MDKDFLVEIDKQEQDRVRQKVSELISERRSDVYSLFRNESVSRALEIPNQANLCGFNKTILPNLVPFSDKVLLEICPTCECVKKPQILIPYLERNLVIPVLGASYDYYDPLFIEKIFGYPHISSYEFYASRDIALMRFKPKLIPPNVVLAFTKRINAFAKKTELGDLENSIGGLFCNLDPYFESDIEVLKNAEKSLRLKNLGTFDSVYSISNIIRQMRNSQAFSFVPQMNVTDIRTFQLMQQLEWGGSEVDFTSFSRDVKTSIMNGLNLSYNSSVPLEQYLDIVSEKKTKIRKIVNDLIDKSKLKKGKLLSNLQAEIEKINEEVASLDTSVRATSFDLVTNFVSTNSYLISGALIGASLGTAGLGFIGCGAGLASGAFSGETAKLLLRKTLKENEARVLRKRISEVIEPFYEKLLSTSLSANTNSIQIWRLRKKLKKTETNLKIT